MDVNEVDRIARQLCDERWGEGHWEGRRTKRNYWRRLARRVLAVRDESDAPELITHLMRAIGWQV